jgi:hypothetical protein
MEGAARDLGVGISTSLFVLLFTALAVAALPFFAAVKANNKLARFHTYQVPRSHAHSTCLLFGSARKQWQAAIWAIEGSVFELPH